MGAAVNNVILTGGEANVGRQASDLKLGRESLLLQVRCQSPKAWYPGVRYKMLSDSS